MKVYLKISYTTFLQLLAPFAPHLTEELWETAGNTESVHLSVWPKADTSLIQDDVVTIGVQVNGKKRGTITIAPDASEDETLEATYAIPGFKERLHGEVVKVIYVPGKILNLIVK